MQQFNLPHINPIIYKKLQPRQLLQQAVHKSLTQSLIKFPNKYSDIIKQISRAKNKIQRIISPKKCLQVVTIEDTVNQNKNFDKLFKLHMYRNKNYDLISTIEKKRKETLPRANKDEGHLRQYYSELNKIYRKGNSVAIRKQSTKTETEIDVERNAKKHLPKLRRSDTIKGFPRYHV